LLHIAEEVGHRSEILPVQSLRPKLLLTCKGTGVQKGAKNLVHNADTGPHSVV
jgi:hypothetical protein